jgi:predicted nucleic acid-binding protein
MPEAPRVLIDTDVWSHVYVPARSTQDVAAELARRLLGAHVVVATQTRAEILAGLAASNWGEPRRQAVRAQLDRTATVPVDERVVQAFAFLVADCKRVGHALQHKSNTGDRWVAATAVAWDLPLLSLDRIYDGAPHLRRWSGIAS